MHRPIRCHCLLYVPIIGIWFLLLVNLLKYFFSKFLRRRDILTDYSTRLIEVIDGIRIVFLMSQLRLCSFFSFDNYSCTILQAFIFSCAHVVFLFDRKKVLMRIVWSWLTLKISVDLAYRRKLILAICWDSMAWSDLSRVNPSIFICCRTTS